MSGTNGATSGTATIEPECVRLPEAGRRLGDISRRMVSNLIREGELDVTWIGSIRMVTVASIREYVKRQTGRGSGGGAGTGSGGGGGNTGPGRPTNPSRPTGNP